jgi:macrolide-specific efflux system membrane fusion protein
MTAQVFFVVGEAKDVPLVPMAALRPVPRGGDNVFLARVANGGEIENRRVEIGLSNRQFAEVKNGLAVGDRVVVGTVEPAPAAADKGKTAIRFRGF